MQLHHTAQLATHGFLRSQFNLTHKKYIALMKHSLCRPFLIQVITLDKSDERFKALQVSIGMCGVLVEVTLKVEAEYRLSELRSGHTLDECINDLDTLSKGERVKFWVDFRNNFCNVFNTSKTVEPPMGAVCRIISHIIVRLSFYN